SQARGFRSQLLSRQKSSIFCQFNEKLPSRQGVSHECYFQYTLSLYGKWPADVLSKNHFALHE
ncbi:MAG: hypothetical protein ACRDF4_02855, partial [Rhabdochlamydiaceae bacterium]